MTTTRQAVEAIRLTIPRALLDRVHRRAMVSGITTDRWIVEACEVALASLACRHTAVDPVRDVQPPPTDPLERPETEEEDHG